MTTQFDLYEGRAGRDAGLELVEQHNASFVSRMREAAKAHALNHGGVHIDDVRRMAAALRLAPRSKNAWGAIFRGRGWRKVGERASTLASNHAHVSPVWAWDDTA